MKNIWYYNYPIGKLGIVEKGGFLVGILFAEKGKPKNPSGLKSTKTPLIAETARQLDEYFTLGRKEFQLPLCLKGTEFQLACWKAVSLIPWGETRTYKEVATNLNKPKAIRAVGLANSRNPLPIIVPCHRVIGSDGSLTGYGGGLPAKQYLLDLEKEQ